MYKLGKLPARKDAVKFRLSNYLTTLPTPPTSHKYPSLSDWNMLGNDKYGDCVFAGAAHETMLWNMEAGKTIIFDDMHVLNDYSTVTGFNPTDPSTDQGTDVQVAASYRRKTGIADMLDKRHTVLAYLAVTPGLTMQLKQAIHLFDSVGIGIQFPESAMSQFNNGKPWTVVKGSRVIGGHYIPAIGYNSSYIFVVTWGKIQKMSWGFYKKYCDECIVYLSNEVLKAGLSPEGFNVDQLQADLAQLK